MRRILPVLPLLLVALALGCARRDAFLTTSRTDPLPLLKVLTERSALLVEGMSGELDMDFRDTERRYRGNGYVVLTPAGRLRLEVPGLFGSTVLLMASDGSTTTVYYPSDSLAYIARDGSASLSSLLPFPMPLDPGTLAGLVMGNVPTGNAAGPVGAYLGASGQRLLLLGDVSGTAYRVLFSAGEEPSLSRLTATFPSGELTVDFQTTDPWLTERFAFTNGAIRMKGKLREAKRAGRLPDSVFTLELPDGVTVRELEEVP